MSRTRGCCLTHGGGMADTRGGRSPSGCPGADDRELRRLDWRAGGGPERLTLGDSREWICSRAAGSVLEVSVGTGLNLRHYPKHLHLTALDLDPQLLSVTRSRAPFLAGVSLLQADASQLPFAASSFDTVVCTLAMCEFRDQSAVLEQMYRLLRPGGRLLLLDHAQWRWPIKGRPVTLAKRVGSSRSGMTGCGSASSSDWTPASPPERPLKAARRNRSEDLVTRAVPGARAGTAARRG
jgi:SAM-dependent methyltransferase